MRAIPSGVPPLTPHAYDSRGEVCAIVLITNMAKKAGRPNRIDSEPELLRLCESLAARGANANQIALAVRRTGTPINYRTCQGWLDRRNGGVRPAPRAASVAPPAPAHRTESESIERLAADVDRACASDTVEGVRDRARQVRELVDMALADVKAGFVAGMNDPGPTNRLKHLQLIERQIAVTLVQIEPKADLEVQRLETLGESSRQSLLERARAALLERAVRIPNPKEPKR